MQTVTISVAEDILDAVNMGTNEFASDMIQEYAVKMYNDGKLTLAQSAHLCSLNIYDFAELLSKAGIPVMNYDPADLEKEMAFFESKC